jgi:small-conductance mechanosensitive channel
MESESQTFYQKYKTSIINSRNKWLEKEGNREKAKEMSREAGRRRNQRIKNELEEFAKLKKEHQDLLEKYNLLSKDNEKRLE